MANPTAAQRKLFAKTGIAMPDGSYYIRPDHPEDLQNAISAVGRASGSDGTTNEAQRNAVRRHVIKRAKALKRTGEIPATWNPDGTLKHSDEGEIVGREDVNAILSHFGVKGMHWGVHKNRSTIPSTPRAKSSTDAARAEKIATKVQSGGVHTLTNKELKDLVDRMNLEQQHSKLTAPKDIQRAKDGKNFVQKYNGHGATGITAYRTTKELVKILGPFVAAAAAAAAARKAGGSSGPVRMPQLAIGA